MPLQRIVDKPVIQDLPTIESRLSFLYVEKCNLECDNNALLLTDQQGVVYIPAAMLSALTVRDITGINPLIIEKEGIGLKVGLKNLSKFIGDCTVVGYNVAFDCRFLEKAYDEQSMDFPITKVKDLLKLIKAKEKGLAGYQLKDVADHYHIKQDVSHRALADAETTAKIFIKLYEKGMIKI